MNVFLSTFDTYAFERQDLQYLFKKMEGRVGLPACVDWDKTT